MRTRARAVPRTPPDLVAQVASDDASAELDIGALGDEKVDVAQDRVALDGDFAGSASGCDRSMVTSPSSATAMSSSSTSQVCARLPLRPASKIGSRPRNQRRRWPVPCPLLGRSLARAPSSPRHISPLTIQPRRGARSRTLKARRTLAGERGLGTSSSRPASTGVPATTLTVSGVSQDQLEATHLRV